MSKRGRTPVIYTRARAQEVRKRVREGGELITAVCADMGMNYENFLRWCRRNKFKVHSQVSRAKARAQPRKPYTLGTQPDTLRQPKAGGRAAAIVEAWREGKLAPTEIAEKHGVCYTYAIRLRMLSGLNPPAKKGRNIKNSNHVRTNSLRYDSIMTELSEGRSVAEVALRHGRSRQGIYNIRKRMNARK